MAHRKSQAERSEVLDGALLLYDAALRHRIDANALSGLDSQDGSTVARKRAEHDRLGARRHVQLVIPFLGARIDLQRCEHEYGHARQPSGVCQSHVRDLITRTIYGHSCSSRRDQEQIVSRHPNVNSSKSRMDVSAAGVVETES